MKLITKIALGIILAAVLMIGGCMALIGGVANQASHDINKQQASHAITHAQFAALKQGEPLSEVLRTLGKPDNRQVDVTKGLGKSVYLYYNVKGGGFGDSYQITFTHGKLDSKSRY